MSKPRRKVLNVRLPVRIIRAVRLIAKRAGTTQTNVVNVLLVVAFMHLEEQNAASIRDSIRRAQAR
jgi:hypothetical protein